MQSARRQVSRKIRSRKSSKIYYTPKSAKDSVTLVLYDGEVTITYRNGKHTYQIWDRRNDLNGVMVPSVTQNLNVLAKPALVGWATRCAGDFIREKFRAGKVYRFTKDEIESLVLETRNAHRRVSQEACDIGTTAHEWIADYIARKTRGQRPPTLPKNEKAKRCCKAARRWLAKVHFKPISVESIVYSRKFGYVGTIDIAGGLVSINGRDYVVDWKSSKDLYAEYRLQMAAYKCAFEEMRGLTGLGRMVIKLGKEDGSFEAFDLPDADYDKDLNAFLGLLPAQKRLRELSVRP